MNEDAKSDPSASKPVTSVDDMMSCVLSPSYSVDENKKPMLVLAAV